MKPFKSEIFGLIVLGLPALATLQAFRDAAAESATP
jgi:hypothetical protein